MNDTILKSITRIIVPFIQVYGVFIILHGHLSPGGGFSGGALIGTSLILFTLVFGVKKAKVKFSERVAEISGSAGIIIYVLVGIVGLVLAGSFLTNIEAGFPAGVAGTLMSAGMIPIIMIGIGIKVASTMITLFHTLVEEEVR
jgi:multicomponent Na+:H+ antiporter subunit B